MKLLLLSNSRTANGWLVDYVPEMREFASGARKAAFVPFAVVQLPWPEVTRKLAEVLPFEIRMVERPADLEGAELLLVCGGNTFQLLRECRNRGLLEPLRREASSGTWWPSPRQKRRTQSR